MTNILISELDTIYLTYDEPRADEFWAEIQANIPWAKRVHGVKGSDAAHKAAAAASDTERFILIDGDNLPNYTFWNEELRLNNLNENCVFRWRAYNNINGLTYGNGGISSWTKNFVQRMRTHESTDGSDATLVEFCFDSQYWAMHDVYSTTYPNQTAYHAWRAGFREGVKLCLHQGTRLTPEEFEKSWKGNRHNLEIWCSVGQDVEHGYWATHGARMGAYLTMFDTNWDYTDVRDFDCLAQLYKNLSEKPYNKILEDGNYYASMLNQRLNLNIVNLDEQQSAWYKAHNIGYHNIDIMLPERDYKRVINETARQFWR